ncbi:MAG TPA: aldehyde dehydrogenase family protein, partial [Gemmatimonadaceae bacterium]|nr:aldehyde dehydrogenase family protein [Gemmatimonadaceae bacterium]
MTAVAMDRFPTRLIIHGEAVEAASGKSFGVVNPATEETIAQVSEAGVADVHRAVESARKTFESDAWRSLSARSRGQMLHRLGELCLTHKDELARLETLNNGKPIFESAIDLRLTAETFMYYGGWADKVYGETIPVDGPFLNYTLREPLGVIGAIVPWNFPMSLAAWKIGPALACGNTIVLKPSEETPFTALRMAELALEAGFPAGAFNCVPGPGRVAGMALVEHEGVDKIAFTGSTEVGKAIMRAGAGTVKKMSMELGGKSPNIVFADADLDAAARGALNGIFYGKGEVCAAGSRLLVEADVKDALRDKILERAKKMVAGDPLHPKTR